MIESWGNKVTQAIFDEKDTKKTRQAAGGLRHTAKRKLDLINGAAGLIDLQAPPSNNLEALKGDLKGFFSIRINDQWRIIFRWEANNAHDVEIVDYH